MSCSALIEIDHQIEKLEFALAISQTNGDKRKANLIRSQIEKIGFSHEEPGT